jgi:hypothetical protein
MPEIVSWRILIEVILFHFAFRPLLLDFWSSDAFMV